MAAPSRGYTAARPPRYGHIGPASGRCPPTGLPRMGAPDFALARNLPFWVAWRAPGGGRRTIRKGFLMSYAVTYLLAGDRRTARVQAADAAAAVAAALAPYRGDGRFCELLSVLLLAAETGGGR